MFSYHNIRQVHLYNTSVWKYVSIWLSVGLSKTSIHSIWNTQAGIQKTKSKISSDVIIYEYIFPNVNISEKS